METKYDIFISYRREDGRELARTLYLSLGKLGYKNVFFDYNSMRGGTFNTQIDVAIHQCKDFVLLLSPRSMERCGIDGDWVAHEIREAIQSGCNIVPVAIDQNYVAWPQDLPRDINIIKMVQQRIMATNELFEASVQLIADMLASKPIVQKIKTSSTCELKISSDETSLLFVDGQAQGKLKGGKQRVLSLTTDCVYKIRLESLAQKGNELIQEVKIEKKESSKTIEFNFHSMREELKKQELEERKNNKHQKEDQRHKEGLLMQVCENYDECGELNGGMKIVSLRGKIGYLNDMGYEAVACVWDDGGDFVGDFATVCMNGKWGIIDKIGQVVVPLQSDTPCWPKGKYRYFIASCNNHYGISTITQGVPDSFPFDEVVMLNEFDNLFAVKQRGLWSIVDVTGTISPFTMEVTKICGYGDSFYSFRSKWEGVRKIDTPLGVQHPGTGRWGYLNSQLKLTVPFVDEGSREITYKSSLKIIKTNGHMGLVNVETGCFIIPAKYDNIHQFYQGEDFDFFRISEGSLCYQYEIDQQGVKTSEDTWYLWGGMQGVINIKGDIVVPQHYQYIELYSGCEDEDPPFFAAYLLKNLQLTWDERSWGTVYLQRQFDKELSSIHIYTANGTIVRKIPYKDGQQIRSIIRETEKKCDEC